MKRFGISTHLYHEERLAKAHLLEIASHGFESVEVFATQSHFDYHDEAAIRSLSDWLAESKLNLHSMHAPITDVFANGQMRKMFSIATRDGDTRKATLHEIAMALNVARIIPFKVLVVHLGVPVSLKPDSRENNREAAIRSLEEIHTAAESVGVQLALEVMGNGLSTPADLVELIERSFEGANIGICMDVGHAHLLGDTAEAIETASEFLVTTHIHDNHRQSDDHLGPFQGNINWPSTMMAFEKIGYDGVLMYEMKAAESARAVLEQAVHARHRLEGLMLDGAQLSAFNSQPDAN